MERVVRDGLRSEGSEVPRPQDAKQQQVTTPREPPTCGGEDMSGAGARTVPWTLHVTLAGGTVYVPIADTRDRRACKSESSRGPRARASPAPRGGRHRPRGGESRSCGGACAE